MPRTATLAAHLSVAELETRYRTTTDVVERTRWHLLWLIGQGHRVAAAADLVGYTHNWALAIVRRYNADGLAGVGDRRAANPGFPPLLTP
ncbi:MAG: helix-turn-helix domain-containing protein, partial [Thermomicrobiales bacterium]